MLQVSQLQVTCYKLANYKLHATSYKLQQQLQNRSVPGFWGRFKATYGLFFLQRNWPTVMFHPRCESLYCKIISSVERRNEIFQQNFQKKPKILAKKSFIDSEKIGDFFCSPHQFKNHYSEPNLQTRCLCKDSAGSLSINLTFAS